ncbi:hypothetical protein [Roseiarcus sp.]|jgi:hypothetical protein
MIDRDDVRYFLAVARGASVRAAAEQVSEPLVLMACLPVRPAGLE